MIKFNKLMPLKTITAFIIFIKYLLWCAFFTLQGKAIDLAIEKSTLYKQLIYTLAGYIFVKMVVMVCEICQKFITEYYKNDELKKQWSYHLPQVIYNDNHNKKSNINVLFFDYLPQIFELEISLITNNVVICCVFIFTTAVFLYTGFFVGLIASLFVFALNYLSKNIFVKKIDVCQKETYHHKIKILNWVEQYFFSYREISKNWQGIANSSWKNEIYAPYFISKKTQIIFYLYRDLLAQILVELPFLLNTCVVILGVYWQYLSLTQLFVWVGFSQFMINASNSYLENKINKKQLITLREHTQSILKSFSSSLSKNATSDKISSFLFSEVVMQDGEINKLSLEPGLYHIKGGNGSGKSTLMNIVLGYERGNYDFKNNNFSSLIESIEQSNVRVIERESIIFECLTDFNSQICGPINEQKNWEKIISDSLSQLVTPELARNWMKVFASLADEYIVRKDTVMSSGEKVIFSLMRFFFSWNAEVNLLIIDECDSFLDQEKKKLFIMTVNELTRHMAVYISCHDISLSKSLENYPIFSPIGLINCDSSESRVNAS